MKAQIAAAATVLAALALAGTADAGGTYQEGRLSFAVSGSYVATGTDTVSCKVQTGPTPADYDYQDTPYPVVEKVSFKSGRGVAFYHGDLGKTPFFGGPHEHGAKLALTVSRTPTLPAGCQPRQPLDCGTHTMKGYVASQFEGPFRAGRPLDLHVRVGDGRYSGTFKSPFTTCGSDSLGPFDGYVINPPVGSQFDAQAKALGYPRPKRFWAHKRLTLSGTARHTGNHGATLVFHMKMKLARKTAKSRPDLHP
jgi:hypothetical protein